MNGPSDSSTPSAPEPRRRGPSDRRGSGRGKGKPAPPPPSTGGVGSGLRRRRARARPGAPRRVEGPSGPVSLAFHDGFNGPTSTSRPGSASGTLSARWSIHRPPARAPAPHTTPHSPSPLGSGRRREGPETQKVRPRTGPRPPLPHSCARLGEDPRGGGRGPRQDVSNALAPAHPGLGPQKRIRYIPDVLTLPRTSPGEALGQGPSPHAYPGEGRRGARGRGARLDGPHVFIKTASDDRSPPHRRPRTRPEPHAHTHNPSNPALNL